MLKTITSVMLRQAYNSARVIEFNDENGRGPECGCESGNGRTAEGINGDQPGTEAGGYRCLPLGDTANPRNTRTARLSRRISSSCRRPMRAAIFAFGTVVILSVIAWSGDQSWIARELELKDE